MSGVKELSGTTARSQSVWPERYSHLQYEVSTLDVGFMLFNTSHVIRLIIVLAVQWSDMWRVSYLQYILQQSPEPFLRWWWWRWRAGGLSLWSSARCVGLRSPAAAANGAAIFTEWSWYEGESPSVTNRNSRMKKHPHHHHHHHHTRLCLQTRFTARESKSTHNAAGSDFQCSRT